MQHWCRVLIGVSSLVVTTSISLASEPGGQSPPTEDEARAPANMAIGLLLPETEPLSLSVRQGALLGVEDGAATHHRCAQLVVRGAVGQWGTDGVEAARLVTDDQVQALIAPPEGAGSHLALQVSGRTATPVISLCPDSSVTRTGVRWMVRITPRTIDEAKAVFAGLGQKVESWIACVPEGRRGREIGRDLAEAAKESKTSLRNVIEVKWPGADLSQLGAEVLTNRSTGILLWLAPTPAASVLLKLRTQGFADWVAGPSWLRCADFLTMAGSAMTNCVIVSPKADRDSNTEFQRFAAAFRSRFSREPDTTAAMSYDAARLLVEIVCRANGRPVHEVFPIEFCFPGVTGLLSFDSMGNRNVELELKEAQSAPLPGAHTASPDK